MSKTKNVSEKIEQSEVGEHAVGVNVLVEENNKLQAQSQELQQEISVRDELIEQLEGTNKAQQRQIAILSFTIKEIQKRIQNSEVENSAQ